MPLEIYRLHLASLQGLDGRRWPGHQCVVVRGEGGAFDLLIGDAAYTPRIYADPGSDHLPAGRASDVPVWRDSVRRIRSLGPERVHFCHHTDVEHR